jgi:type II secretory pathway pseudopilin PulG
MAFCAYCGTPVTAISYTPCAACGNPLNGAPARRAVKGSNTAAVIAIVVVGVLVVVAIIGILAAIAIPNLLTAMQRSKQRRTMADMLTMAGAVEAYAEDNNKHFPDAISIDQLSQSLSPKYVQRLQTKDGWANQFRYDCWSTSGSGPCDSYVIASAGKDGKFEVEDPTKYQGRGATTNFDDDIVFENGKFIQSPEGIATRR